MPLRLIVAIAFFSAWLPVCSFGYAPTAAASGVSPNDAAFPAASFLEFRHTENNEMYVMNENTNRKIRAVISIKNKKTGAVEKRTVELEPGMKLCMGFARDPQTEYRQKFHVETAEFLSPDFDQNARNQVMLRRGGSCGPHCLNREFWLENKSDQYVLVVLEQGGYNSGLIVQSHYMLAPDSRTPVACPVGNLVPNSDPQFREQQAFAIEGARFLLPNEVACIQEQQQVRQLSMSQIQGVVVDPQSEQVIILEPVIPAPAPMAQTPEQQIECVGNCPALPSAPRCRTACADLSWMDDASRANMANAEAGTPGTVSVLAPLRRYYVGCSSPTFGVENPVCNMPQPTPQP